MPRPHPASARRRTQGPPVSALPALLVAALLMAVAPTAAGAAPAAPAAPTGAAGGELTVLAASSLHDAFDELAAAFGARSHSRVVLGFGGSSTLATQLLQGAPAGVFASADAAQMARVEAAGLTAAPPRPFARNRLVVLHREGVALRSLEDLARPGLLLALAAPQVPAGAYAERALQQAAGRYGDAWREAVLANVVTREPNVRQVAAKVALGEADAALVYATDVRGLERVAVLELPAAANVDADYLIAPLRGAPEAAAEAAAGASAGASEQAAEQAAAFVAFVLSPAGQALLARHGFAPPTPTPASGD